MFTANLDQNAHSGVCRAGLMRIMRDRPVSDAVFGTIERGFGKASNRQHITDDLAKALIDAIEGGESRCDLSDFLEWLESIATDEPLRALVLCERMAEVLDRLGPQCQIWHTGPLLSALTAILREADESDDPELIRRAVTIQDRFLRMDLHGIDGLFAEAERF